MRMNYRFISTILIFVLLFSCLLAGCTGGGNATVVVENVAALRQLDGKNASAVITAGYHRSGDGCGFTYIKDPAAQRPQDNGGSVIVANDGTCWRAIYDGALPLKLFGAVGDGKQDDTAAIRAWIAALQEGDCGYAAAGKYRFSETIVFPMRQNVSIRGDGAQQTIFLYAGEDKNCDLFVIGTPEVELHGWNLESFSIDSKKTMEGGAALHLINMKHTTHLRDVSASRVDGRASKKLWNGVFFDNCSLTNYVGFEIFCQNAGVMLAGLEGSDSSADILLDQGTINFSRIGIHCGGGVGGLYVGQVLVYGSTEIGYLQDNALVARGNREIFISDQCVLDACHSYCAFINDSLSKQGTLDFKAFITGAGWLEPATPGTGISIQKLPQGRVSIGSQHIKHCKANGVEVLDLTTYVHVSPATYIVGNGGWGFFTQRASQMIDNQANMFSNTKGNTNVK